MVKVFELANQEESETGLTLAFPWGLPGLEYREFTLTSPGGDSPFYYLQSTEEPDVGLLLVYPFLFFQDYEFDLPEEVINLLKISEKQQVAVLCAINTSKGFEKATVNLLAPIVINIEQMVAKQVVLYNSKYSLRTPLFPEVTAVKGDE